tara:strand:- start:14991 stop:15770 length:780 start_codon:yes stop_codon:yes gene_type:complete
MKNKDLAIIVLSCDGFSSLWPLFFKRLDQYFPISDAKFYLLTNHLDYKISGKHSVEVVCVGDDISWSDNLSKLLLGIQENNVLLLIEDGPFSMRVDIGKIDFFYQMFLDENMNYLNLKATPLPDKNIGEFVGEISRSMGYRTALVPSMWKKKVLVNLLKSGESAWEFEVFGSERSKEYGEFYAVKKPIFSFDHIVIKGKVDRGVYRKLKNNDEHIGIDFPVMSFWEFFREKVNVVRSRAVNLFLPDYILALLRKIKYGE